MKKSLAFAAAIAAPLALAAPAQAAPASVYSTPKHCAEVEEFTYCFAERVVAKETLTPSGNTILTLKGTSALSVEPLGYLQYARYSETTISKADELHVVTDRYFHEFTYLTSNGFETCSSEGTYVYANGEVRIDNATYTCV